MTTTLIDCWNSIGVNGDQSCPKLVQHVHCRNCEVYAGAAQRNLQRPVGPEYREEWASHFRLPAQARSINDSAVLAFRIGREWLAMPAANIAAVAPTAPSHRLPHRDGGALLGIVNVAGKLLPSVSLATLLGVDERDAVSAGGRHTFARLLVMTWDEQSFAIPVADLHGIVRYASGALQPPPATINRGLVRYLTGIVTESTMHIGVLDAALLGHQMARLLR